MEEHRKFLHDIWFNFAGKISKITNLSTYLMFCYANQTDVNFRPSFILFLRKV